MSVTITVRPSLLRWARERAELEPADLAKKVGLALKRILAWEETGQLQLDHLERVAQKTHTPIGFLFLPEPPQIGLPIADFRSRAKEPPSLELIETVFQCEQRQEWYRGHVLTAADELAFVGSARPNASVGSVAEAISTTLGLTIEQRASAPTSVEALTDLCTRSEEAGVLVMRSGIVGNNTHRPLSVQEFRGFALSDRLAPLIFVNAADAKAAQIFTLVHELAHVWRGESGVSDVAHRTDAQSERFCNQVAAEVLVPMQDFQRAWRRQADAATETRRLAHRYKVSTLVILIRALEAEVLPQADFTVLYNAELEAARNTPSKGGGGDFYRTQKSRLGTKFAAAVIASALEGNTSYSEAFSLLGVRKLSTFEELGREVGVIG